ncbi:hypothetical protein RFI_07598 [Reticulomyxa filosa]|uniref:Uncharacterized protein n=1 Tax=Reticulomyxa filosa TaxID=46433 RepID=X6NW74_RETFI|nr:hypothetical protein RFI_07598 [Reticulomyxa filosa]|eukprot:ETO29522.1 hypothetical protein RFI_07598 [Reticulomyxa filosa]
MISGINQLIVDSTSSLKRSYVDAEPTNVYTSLNGGQSSGNVGTDIKDEVYLHNKKQREAEKIQPTNDKPAPFVNVSKLQNFKIHPKDIAKVRDSRTIQITATNKIVMFLVGGVIAQITENGSDLQHNVKIERQSTVMTEDRKDNVEREKKGNEEGGAITNVNFDNKGRILTRSYEVLSAYLKTLEEDTLLNIAFDIIKKEKDWNQPQC